MSVERTITISISPDDLILLDRLLRVSKTDFVTYPSKAYAFRILAARHLLGLSLQKEKATCEKIEWIDENDAVLGAL